MKKNGLLLALLLTVVGAQAQHVGPDPVTPASKGTLPEMPALEKPADGRFGGLQLVYTTLSPFQSTNWAYEVYLEFPTPKSLGGDSYTLQLKRYGENSWETVADNITGNDIQTHFYAYTFRLVLHGGDKDGWLSNEVTCQQPQIASQMKSRQYNPNLKPYVDSQVQAMSLTYRTYHDINDLKNYTDYQNDASFKRTWYRRNPYTGTMVSTGVHDAAYTVTLDDVGYEVVEVVEGDKVKTDFYYALSHGVAKMPVNSSAEYFYEGFIVNTEYDIPNAGDVLGFQVYSEEHGAMEVQPFAPENFRVLAPGRYAITCPWTQYGWQYLYAASDYFDVCEQSWGMAQPLYLWAAPGNLETLARLDGDTIQGAKINLLEKNMDGHMQYVYTSTDGYLTAASYITLYAKAVGVGEGCLPTYYPNALLWTDAQSFDAQEMYHSEEGPQPIAIDVRRDFAPLGGQCAVEGLIEGTLPVPMPLISVGQSVIGTWNYYMTDENDEPIRTPDMLRVQATFNDDGTFVLSIPVWGEVQSGTWSWWNTGTTIYLQVTKVVQGETEVYEGDALVEWAGGDPDSDRLKIRTDISFDALGNLHMELFGLPCLFEREGAEQPSAEPVYVYLRQKGGDIVAAARMQADGTYSFRQVPFGTYEVIPNIDGYDVEIQSVTLTESNSTATEVDYVVLPAYSIVSKKTAQGVQAPSAAVAAGADRMFDLSGRRVNGKSANGLVIRNGKKVMQRK